MPYIIDGNNLIGAIPVIDIRDPDAREKLTHLLSRYQKAKGNRITVVYDGPPPPGAPPEVHMGALVVIYAGPESDADTRIKSFIRQSRNPGAWTVVSSDKQVYSYCKWAGAQAMRVMPFFSDMKRAIETGGGAVDDFKGMSEEDVQDWMNFFGISDEAEE
jgi:predicted RNA-binding protein with PIN domain